MAKMEKKATKTIKKTEVKEPVKTVASNKETKPAAKAEVKKAEAKPAAKKAEPKKENKAVKKEVKKLTAAKEPEKISAKPEPKKITAAKEPEKITAKPEPKKLEEKKPSANAEVKKPTKKAPVKKAEAPKPEAKPVSKAAKTEAPKAVKATKQTKKAEAAKKTEKAPAKKAVKKAPAKKTDQEKLKHYQELPLEECIRLMQVMQVHYSYDDYYQLLMEEADLAKLEQNIMEGNHIREANFIYAETGCDEDLVIVTLQKVAETMDIKAADYKTLKKEITKALKFKLVDDAEKNAAQYLDEFKLSEKLLMIGQRKGLANAKEVTDLIGADVVAYFQHFFDFAYALLPSWQYNDVKFYEDFAYAVLSQFADLFESEQLRIQIDVADLYIKHGDFQHGDEMYGYILRDNQIKDYIYYRYASVYKEIDFNKAKSIAYSSLQYVDDRYTFYPNIMEIINQ